MTKLSTIVLLLLCCLVNTLKLSDYHKSGVTSCLRDSYRRGDRSIPSKCPSGYEFVGTGLCYLPCPSGYKRKNDRSTDYDCYQNCPSIPGWEEFVSVCNLVDYKRGQGYALLVGEVGDAKVI
jgi:hypothetical protein